MTAQSIDYLIYDPSTGYIKRFGYAPESDLTNIPFDGESVMTGTARNDVHYIDLTDPANPVIADKASVPLTVTGNLITLPGDALRCEVSGPVTDSFTIPAGETELTFTADAPGQYTLTLSGVKYLETEVSIAI